MADFNATFAAGNTCTLLNVGNINALCTCCQKKGGLTRHRLNKDVRKRAKKSAEAICSCHHGNVLTRCHGRRRCC